MRAKGTVLDFEKCLFDILDAWNTCEVFADSVVRQPGDGDDRLSGEDADRINQYADALLRVGSAYKQLVRLAEKGLADSIPPPPGQSARAWTAQMLADAAVLFSLCGMIGFAQLEGGPANAIVEADEAYSSLQKAWVYLRHVVPNKEPGGNGRRKTWTEELVHRKLAQWKAGLGTLYSDVLAGTKSNKPGAKKKAREMFAQRAIQRKLGVPEGSREHIKTSPAYQAIVDDFGPEFLGLNRGPARRKIGLDIAAERAAEAAGDTTAADVEQRETARQLEALIAKASGQVREHLEAIRDKHNEGLMTDAQALDAAEMVIH